MAVQEEVGSREFLPGAERFRRRSALGMLALVVGAVPFLVLLLLVRREWSLLREADDGVADGLNGLVAPHGPVVGGLEALTELGGFLGATYVLLLTAAFLWIRRRRRLTAYVLTTGLGLLVLVPLTKVLVGRERPRVPVPVTDLPGTDSFPSGHAMTALVTWVVVALVVAPSVRGRWRRWLLPAAVLLAAAIGATRLALGVHYLSDVLAGWTLGAGWLAVTTALFRTWQAEEGRTSPSLDQGLEAHGTPLAPLQDRPLPDGGRASAPLAGTAVLLVAVAAGLSATVPPGQGLPGGPVLAALTAPWTVAAVTVALAVLVLAVQRRRRPALLPLRAVAGAVLITLAAAALAPGGQGPSWHAAGSAAAYGSLAATTVSGRSRPRWAVLVLPAVLATVSAASRGGTGWVAALVGALLGTVWLATCVRAQPLPAATAPQALRNPVGPVGARR